MKKLDFESPPLLVEKITEFIREAILRGTFKQGERLKEINLQRMFNVSRSPIREALRSLEREGLVVIIPRKGAYVSRITPSELRDMTVVRASLEGLAARLAVPNMDGRHIRKMERLLEKMRGEVEREDLNGFTRTHHEFHEVFISRCGNEFLKEMLEKIRIQYFRTGITKMYFERMRSDAVEGHRKILDAFRKKDPDEAERVVKEHILRVSENELFWNESL